ncbi:Indole diterpene prenyltransferase ltmF [Apiospora saccharicola]|uniref:Indole diterpene prenyltransferase ltmF n=1 Tax=Apiospora saccharicola TaxID=335842 RepID=A0ABR1TQ29_9PEZI
MPPPSDSDMLRAKQYWTEHCTLTIGRLMKSTGSYSKEDVQAQLRFLGEHVAPHLGPVPSQAAVYGHGPSLLTQTGSPLMPNLNISRAKAKVRYTVEILGSPGESENDPLAIGAARRILPTLTAEAGLSTAWMDPLLEALSLTKEECATVSERLPEWLASICNDPPAITRLPFCFVAFDLEGPAREMKAYFNLKPKQLATGIPMSRTAFDVIRKLEQLNNPAGLEALEALETFLDQRKGLITVELLGMDCVPPRDLAQARIKLYVNAASNAFHTVRDVVTLGGRRADQATAEYLATLRQVWHLLINEPRGLPVDDEGWEKPLKDPRLMSQRLYFSFELRSGMALPEVKTYLPTWNYAQTDEQIVRNYDEVFRLCGSEWGEGGRYRTAFESTFGSADHDRPVLCHTDASFFYTKEKGIYQTLYYSPSLSLEPEH